MWENVGDQETLLNHRDTKTRSSEKNFPCVAPGTLNRGWCVSQWLVLVFVTRGFSAGASAAFMTIAGRL